MCLIITQFQVCPAHPLVVAANRDELYGRPARSPSMWGAGFVAGKDVEAGGTWLGATPDGFFVGLTNQRSFKPRPEGLRSRGEVPVAMLRTGGFDAARRALSEIEPASYLPFNLLFGDPAHLAVAYVRPNGVELSLLEPGVHVLANDRMGSPLFPKERRVRSLLEGLTRPCDPAALAEVLRDRTLPDEEPPGELPPHLPRSLLRELQAICTRTPGYGTCSATVLRIAEHGLTTYLHADGPPDRSDFVPYWPAPDPGSPAP